MIEVRTKNGRTEISSMCGDLTDLCSDLSCIISAMYHLIKDKDEDVAECFKDICKDHVMDITFGDTCEQFEVEEESKKTSKKSCKSDNEDGEINELFMQMMRSRTVNRRGR